jgi:hypothetical protein
MNIDLFSASIPPNLMGESGKVFYSGRSAFSRPSTLYVLGVNPGGDPESYAHETVRSHTRRVIQDLPADWSAYRDESWEGATPGSHGMAPRVLHLFAKLGLDPACVPASNLIFVRSRREEQIKHRLAELSDQCWAFHALVIEKLKPRVILCLGTSAGDHVRGKLGAHRLVDQFVEQNARRWTSRTFESDAGIRVVVATHPSIADWRANSTDPSRLVAHALGASPAVAAGRSI